MIIATPVEFTADHRQGNFDAYTLGLEYGLMRGSIEFQIALEYYQQQHDQPSNAPGQLANQDIVPDLDAVLLRLNYNF